MIRITGGVHRGRVVRDGAGPGVRPTAARVREALFSILGQDLSGTTVLDAYGGAGLVALEARSRGAQVTVVERDRRTARAIADRARELDETVRVRVGDVLRFAPNLGTFDGVFADPPYATDPATVLRTLGPLARTWFVLETDAATEAPDMAGDLPLDRVRKYGRTRLWVYRHPDEADAVEEADEGA